VISRESLLGHSLLYAGTERTTKEMFFTSRARANHPGKGGFYENQFCMGQNVLYSYIR